MTKTSLLYFMFYRISLLSFLLKRIQFLQILQLQAARFQQTGKIFASASENKTYFFNTVFENPRSKIKRSSVNNRCSVSFRET